LINQAVGGQVQRLVGWPLQETVPLTDKSSLR
jgi:hypothetical protein